MLTTIEVPERGSVASSPPLMRSENRWTQKDSQRPFICRRLIRAKSCVVRQERRPLIHRRPDYGWLADELAGESAGREVIPRRAVVSHRRERNPRSGLVVESLLQPANDVSEWDMSHAVELGRCIGSVALEVLRNDREIRRCESDHRMSCAGTHDESVDDGIVRVSEFVAVDCYRSRRVSPERDSFWVASELGYVVSDPFYSEPLIEVAEVQFVGLEACCVWPAEDVETVIDADHDVLPASLHPAAGVVIRDIDSTYTHEPMLNCKGYVTYQFEKNPHGSKPPLAAELWHCLSTEPKH